MAQQKQPGGWGIWAASKDAQVEAMPHLWPFFPSLPPTRVQAQASLTLVLVETQTGHSSKWLLSHGPGLLPWTQMGVGLGRVLGFALQVLELLSPADFFFLLLCHLLPPAGLQRKQKSKKRDSSGVSTLISQDPKEHVQELPYFLTLG